MLLKLLMLLRNLVKPSLVSVMQKSVEIMINLEVKTSTDSTTRSRTSIEKTLTLKTYSECSLEEVESVEALEVVLKLI